MNQKHLKLICTKLQLGSPDETVISVSGGRGGHLMWRVNTEKGSYAIKQLAPDIDLNNEKMITKYELSETIAYRFMQRGISAISALEKSGKHLNIIENTGYLVYPWVEAHHLERNEISEIHAFKVAEILARLHSINLSVPEIKAPRFDIHSNESIIEAIDRAVAFNCPFAKILKENQSLILTVNDSYLAVIPVLSENTVVTHGDLDQNNILWDKAGQPILIDWESAKKMNPTREIVRTSLSWGGDSLSIYTLMLRTYIKSGGILNKNLIDAALHAVFGSMVNWMLFNIEIVCTSDIKEKQDAGIEEIKQVLAAMVKLKILIPDLLKISENL